MLFSSSVTLISFLAGFQFVRAIPRDYWISLDCYVADVTVDNKPVNNDHSLKPDWQLTAQTCKNNYGESVAKYQAGAGRCVSVGPDGISGPQWWDNCKQQAKNGWYDIDPVTMEIVQDQSPYKSDYAEGRGYPA